MEVCWTGKNTKGRNIKDYFKIKCLMSQHFQTVNFFQDDSMQIPGLVSAGEQRQAIKQTMNFIYKFRSRSRQKIVAIITLAYMTVSMLLCNHSRSTNVETPIINLQPILNLLNS